MDDISIHAPLAGCDTSSRSTARPASNFNPRTPCGVRLFKDCLREMWQIFQSTHPLRGATNQILTMRDFYNISIHAPLAGCDCKAGLFPDCCRISIHAPLAGCDSDLPFCKQHVRISIHAPLAGCDGNNRRLLFYLRYFNPRTPCGVRPVPCRIFPSFHAISIHAPLAGCDNAGEVAARRQKYFNPRTPCGVRRVARSNKSDCAYFNPRTPCGVRLIPLPPCKRVKDFNPRTPCGVRRPLPCQLFYQKQFQSTHPLRGATRE